MYLLHGAEKMADVLRRLSADGEVEDPGLAGAAEELRATDAAALSAVADGLATEGAALPDPAPVEAAGRTFHAATDAVAVGTPAPDRSRGVHDAGSVRSPAEQYASRVFVWKELTWLTLVAVAHCRVASGAEPGLSGRLGESALVTELSRRTPPARKWVRRVRRNLTPHSVHLRNSLRLALGLTAARLLVGVLDLHDGFWVMFATLIVVKTSAAGTRATAVDAALGTVIGFAAAVGLLAAFGVNDTLFSVLVFFLAFLAFYLPPAGSLVGGQAAFTVMVVVLFNLLAPVGWAVALVRLENVLLGAAIGIVIGVAVWPQGAAPELGRTLAALVRAGDRFAVSTVYVRTGEVGDDEVQASRYAAQVTAVTTEDVFSQWLSEPHRRETPVTAWSSLMASAHRVWFGAVIIETLRIGAGAGPDHVEAVALDAGAGAVHAGHEELAGAIEDLGRRRSGTGAEIPAEEPGHPGVPVFPAPEDPAGDGGGIRLTPTQLGVLEVQAWLREMEVDTARALSCVERVKGADKQGGILRSGR